MAFVAGQQIFTSTGWKPIESLSGQDKVLVRNFIGDAEFIQPFALKKTEYDGEVVQIGAKDWSFTVTPQHKVLYERKGKVLSEPAIDLELKGYHRIYRKFRYMFPEEVKKEYITIFTEFGKKTVTIQHEDWYKLAGYILCRGFIKTGFGRPMLMLFLDEYNIEEEIMVLGDILDRIGVYWHVQYSEKTRPKIVISSKNTLASRVQYRLGSLKRKEMFLPPKMIFNSTKEQADILVQAIKDATKRYDTPDRSYFQMSTTNIKFIESLTLLGTIHGYGVRHYLSHRAGDEMKFGTVKQSSYVLTISDPTDTYAPKYKNKKHYKGKVYEIDLFNGQVYIKEGSMPIWIDPK